ncbi:hypothetical protein PBV87_11455 [Niameybacter massiliensis]|uniref:Holin n=1 Tax=Holtiella tumoricola TaxID=3018743 RepID=A0AA42DN61_9FIRM|nr:hypothetical protein [Holtiella tumoricola]MDA3732099.1 hypothetical protein [Holtiella tumoricola]
MDIATIQGLITGVGFPIFCVLALGFFGYKVWVKSQEQHEKREERSYQMLEGFKIALDNFGNILAKYDAKLSTIEGKIDKIEEKIEGK